MNEKLPTKLLMYHINSLLGKRTDVQALILISTCSHWDFNNNCRPKDLFDPKLPCPPMICLDIKTNYKENKIWLLSIQNHISEEFYLSRAYNTYDEELAS